MQKQHKSSPKHKSTSGKSQAQSKHSQVQRSPQQILQRSLNGVAPSHGELIQLQSAMGNRAFQQMVRSSTEVSTPRTERPAPAPTAAPKITYKANKRAVQAKRTVLGRIGWGGLSTLAWGASGAVPLSAMGGKVGYGLGKGKNKIGAGGLGFVGGLVGLLGLPGLIAGGVAIDTAADATFGTKKERKGLNDKGEDLSKSIESLNSSSLRTFNVSDVTIPSTKFYGTLKGRKYVPNLDSRYTKSDEGSGKVVIMFSGSGGTNEQQLGWDVAPQYCARGYTVYGIDYRGYGKSSQRVMLSEAGMYDDAMRIYKYVRKQESVSDNKIVIHGFSLGGAVASHLVKTLASKKKRVGGLILHSAIDSAYRVANRAGTEEFNSVVGGYGGMATKAGVGDFDTIDHLKSLSKRKGFEDLPIHFMSGTHKENSNRTDHLDLKVTGLHELAEKYGFENTTSSRSNFGHMSTKWHMQDQDESLYSRF